jgi:hypothetical protein
MNALISNNIVENIINEIENLSIEEQQVLLTQLRATRLLKENKPISKAKNVKPISDEELDKIKHESRKGYAN